MEVVRGKTTLSSATKTRPSDTNAYTIGDVINESTSAGTGWTFVLPGVGEVGSCILQSATIISSSNVATKLEGRLWLFDTAPAADNDNAEFTPTDVEMLRVLQVIEFPTSAWLTPGATPPNAICNAQGLWLPINTTKDANAIFGVLEARNAYVPTSGEVFTIKLGLVL